MGKYLISYRRVINCDIIELFTQMLYYGMRWGGYMKNRINFFDFLKTISMFLVCFYHFKLMDFHFVEDQAYFMNIDYLIYCVSSIAVPIFFMVNGALLLNRNYNYESYIKKAIKLYILLIIWKCINVVAAIYVRKITGYTMFSFISLLFSNNFPNVDLTYLWFIHALIAIYLIAPILKYLYDNNQKLFNHVLIVISCFSFGFVLLNIILQFIEWHFRLKSGSISYIDLTYSNPFGVYAYAILYFALGGITYKNLLENSLQKIKSYMLILSFLINWVALALWGITFSNIGNYVYDAVFNGYQTPMTAVMAASIFILFSRVKIQNKFILKTSELISNNCFGIYLVHWVLGYIYISDFYRLLGGMRMKMQNLLHAVFLLAVSLLITIVIKKIPILKKSVTL